MTVSITLNNVNINTGNTTVRTVQHDSMPKIFINSLKPTRQDGEKLINTKLSSKIITIEGTVKGDDQDTYESNLDTLKDNFNIERKNLDIEYAGATRRYSVTLRSFTTIRDFFNVSFANYTAMFVVETGYGTDTAITQAATGNALDDTLTSFAVNYGGTHTPYPLARFVIDTVGNLDSIAYKSVQSGEEISASTAWADGDQLVIDSEQRTFLLNGSLIDFSGEFPKFVRGDDTVQLKFTPSGGIDQQQIATDGDSFFAGDNEFVAQSFQVSATENYQTFEVFGKKVSGDEPNLNLRIETDNGGEPSGTLVDANADITVTSGNLPSSLSWIILTADAAFNLNISTTYWMVFKATGAGSETFEIESGKNNPYSDGVSLLSVNSGSTWISLGDDDLTFRIHSTTGSTASIDFKQTYIKKYL